MLRFSELTVLTKRINVTKFFIEGHDEINSWKRIIPHGVDE